MKKIHLYSIVLLLFFTAKISAQDQYVGEIRMFAGNFAPLGWLKCEGQLVSINEYETLFVLIGTTYGGDGQSTFALPDLRGRIPVHQGTGPGLTTRTIGETFGTEEVTLTVNNIPAHTHTLTAVVSTTSKSASVTGNVLSDTGAGDLEYVTSAPNSTLATNSVALTGSTTPASFNNVQSTATVGYIISTQGIFPFQN
jgi:microcystin-dependent protein